MHQRPNYKSRFKILKGGKIALIISALLGSVTISMASPVDGVVTSGSATISQVGNTTNINQSTSKATINWSTFNIASNETVNFNQPNINSITLNRVTGNQKSIIDGVLNANGQVWILNSNGVLFGSSAKINTSGLLVSTKNLSDADFNNNNNYMLQGDSTNSIINLGTIDIVNKGYATLIADSVSNEGTIKAIKGTIHLVGANAVTINLNGNSMLQLSVDKGVLDALVKNSGSLYANAGEIYLTTNAVNDLLKGVVNNTGVIEAQSLNDVTGKIELFAHGGEVQVGGTLKANDGFIETSGKTFTIAKDTIVQTGDWLIDPTNITIDSILASTLQTQLISGNALVTTTAAGADSGDINVNSSISWSANTLTLHADNDINIKATLNASSTAGLALEYAQTTGTGTYNISAPVNIASTGSFSTKYAGDTVKNYTVITTLGSVGSTTGTDLQGINGNLSGNYVLGYNIDASEISEWFGIGAIRGFYPIGKDGAEFTGIFDGLGHTISNLRITRPITDNIGLFGKTTGSTIQNVGMLNADIKGSISTGGLVGSNYHSTINNSYVTGSVVGGSSNVGGLVGNNYYSTINNSYSTASVSNANSQAYYFGGLVGNNSFSGIITNSYATGNVNLTGDSEYVGGLVGSSISFSKIINCYATGSVSAVANVGGLLGSSNSSATVTNSFWDIQTTGQVTSSGEAGAIGLTTSQMKNTKTFFDAGWDLDTIWGRDTNNVQNSGYLDIRGLDSFSFNTVVSTTVANQSKVYDATADVSAIFSKASIIDSIAFGSKDVGTYIFTTSSGDYELTYTNGFNDDNVETLFYSSGSTAITKKALTISGISGNNKVYDATTAATVSATLGGLISGDSVSIASTFDNVNVGTTKTVTLNSLAGTDGGNYFATLGQTTIADITKKSLTLSDILTSNKVYDATISATTTATLTGVISGDILGKTITSTFNNKNAGTAKTVTLNMVTLEGIDAGNYSIVSGQISTADITKKSLTISSISTSNKVYDATNTATVNADLGGLISGDSVSISSTFDNKNAGTAKTVTLNSLAGTDGANYFATLGQTTTADVSKKALNISNIIGNNKVYDGTTTATVSATLGGFISGDSVSIASTFDNKNVGIAKRVTLNSLAGTDAGNYFATLGQTTTADIISPISPTINSIIAFITNKSALRTIRQNARIKQIAGIDSSALDKLVEKYDKNPLLY